MIKLERTAEDGRTKLAGLDGEEHDAQWRRWRKAAEAFHAAVTKYAASGGNRYELEMAAKKAVRHPEPEAAAAYGHA
ncbi:hypothetical protein H1V43_21150 [Streptomyces sp. PSKA54]|uniref:Uncharacterized protein n=1 Tax=Streptomyces himalayensis subsp. aureolus TaxID=2758039 RepID=A0A7W2D311_9ACTN|nr:hypothetical protein [Streptomyces himalayensis subsp. aureolus]